MSESGPRFLKTNGISTPRPYQEGAITMLGNTHCEQTISPALLKPFVAIPPCDSCVRQICTTIFIPHFTNQETGAPKVLGVINQGHLAISTPQGLVSIFTLKKK